mmetsp:Transcript_24907/g.51613  ORF Transcript_24907/g.51613 Transcript_24907/m.51613 type:complete len:377 (+) Transcript_24907:129-1259(+)
MKSRTRIGKQLQHRQHGTSTTYAGAVSGTVTIRFLLAAVLVVCILVTTTLQQREAGEYDLGNFLSKSMPMSMSMSMSQPTTQVQRNSAPDAEHIEATTGTSTSTTQTTSISPSNCDSPSRGHFDEKYAKGKWSTPMKAPSDFYGDARWPPKNARQKSASGRGSWLGYNTETSLDFIKSVIVTHNVRSMVDIPCGDVNWIHDSFETDTLPLYVGLDITSAVIDVNNQRFAHHNNKEFYFWDASECPMPRILVTNAGVGTASTQQQQQQQQQHEQTQPFDLIHVRDVIQHIPQEMGVRYLCNVLKSGAKLLITTTFRSNNHEDTQEGGFYKNDLTKEPFLFPESNHCVETHPKTESDDTCLYDLREGTWVQDYIARKC